MHKYLILIVLIVTTCNAQKKTNPASAHYEHARRQIEDKDFFHARDYIAANRKHFSKFHATLLDAAIDNAFNRPAASNKKIDAALKEYASQLPDSARLNLLRLKQENHGRLFEYRQAAIVTDEILQKYIAILKPEDMDDYKNTGEIWHTLAGQPKQEMVIESHTTLQMILDKAGLANLEVMTPYAKTDFIFDTGANISVVTRSAAEKNDMKMLGGSIEVGSITGAKVNAEMAICPEFRLGNIVVKNAVFLVFPDDALAFPQIDYQINGILGFPVIEAMKEVQITQKDEFIVPKARSVSKEQNMALDFLTPVININDEHYTFDTGATDTSLYAKYFEKHREDVVTQYKETDLEFGGAGGMASVKGYNVIFMPVINGNEIRIENVHLYSQSTGNEKDMHYYGNIGQDLIKRFDRMTLNFESMFIKFD